MKPTEPLKKPKSTPLLDIQLPRLKEKVRRTLFSRREPPPPKQRPKKKPPATDFNRSVRVSAEQPQALILPPVQKDRQKQKEAAAMERAARARAAASHLQGSQDRGDSLFIYIFNYYPISL